MQPDVAPRRPVRGRLSQFFVIVAAILVASLLGKITGWFFAEVGRPSSGSKVAASHSSPRSELWRANLRDATVGACVAIQLDHPGNRGLNISASFIESYCRCIVDRSMRDSTDMYLKQLSENTADPATWRQRLMHYAAECGSEMRVRTSVQ